MVRKTRPGAVRRPSRSRPQRLGSRRWQWIGSGGAHQRLPTRRRSSERERESRNAGPLSNPGVALPSSRRWAQEATGKVRGAADGWVRGAADGWVCVKLCMGGEPGALAAASVGAPNGTDRRRSASDRRGSGCAPALGVRARGSSPPFSSAAAFHAASAQLRGCEGFSWYNVGPRTR